MSGLYIHIPFCKSRCVYCGFYSTTHTALERDYVGALLGELALRRSYLPDESWRTIYIGGGTPSQLSAASLGRLFGALDLSRAAEVTMECNPDDVTPEYARHLAALGVNRVSMGAQTFSDARLKFLRRRHDAAETAAAVEALRSAGIGNISIDLMYGFPGETLDEWRRDIAAATALGVEHLSAYCLMYEEGTPLYNMRARGEVAELGEEQSRAMFELLCDELARAGYEHYEISNFARPGFRSVHNSSYWRQTPYMGIGAAAHSFDGSSRQWNVADLRKYIGAIGEGRVPFEREELDADTRYDEAVMLRLRTVEGLDLDEIAQRWGRRRLDYCMKQAATYLGDGLLELSGSHLRLTRRGLFVSDMIMSDLMAG